jgi:hypothetical protein
MTRTAVVAAFALMFCGCAARTWRVTRDANAVYLTSPAKKATPVPVSVRGDASHLDLAQGWRLRVITPILKSGGYQIPTVAKQQGLTIEIDSQGEFLGMETAFYSVEPGLRIKLASVEAMLDGKTKPREKPLAKLFEFPSDARHMRLVYLTRVSQADHDMAVVSGTTVQHLDELTRRVHSTSECASPYCAWVPAGIAVLAQVRVKVDGVDTWIAANSAVREVLRAKQPVQMLRTWRGKPVPVTGVPSDLVALPLADGDVIRTR